jgi:dTDP-4-amino-4,6-dideoxygalactose transaminase
MRVERYNYAAQFDSGDVEALTMRFREILTRGNYVPSAEGTAFEDAFARFTETSYARGVGCGTDALILAMRSLGIGPNDEVVTQANTFFATVAAIALVGATPVLVDADDETFLIDEKMLLEALTPKTRAIIVVHLYGKPTPMLTILREARRRGIAVIEDAAQAHGAQIHGRSVGSFGDAGCFSFHASKNLAAAGDGGCVVTSSRKIADLVEAYRTHGQLVQHEHIVMGMNSKLDAIQSLILSIKLPRLLEWNARRREIAARYRAELDGRELTFQRNDLSELHAYHLFVVRTRKRDELVSHLQRLGVDAVVRYPYAIHEQPPFADFGWKKGQFPVAERLAKELLCLPLRPDMSVAEQDHVIESVLAHHGALIA